MSNDNLLDETESSQAALKHQLAVGVAMASNKDIPTDAGHVPAVLIPEGYKLETLEDLQDRYASAPTRLKQSVVLRDPDSFIAYLKRHSTDSVAVFCDVESLKFVGILDYHDGSIQPHHCEHTAKLVLEKTRELETWLEHDREPMDQTDFARFIEDNAPEIIAADLGNGITTPSGSDMLQIALTLSRTESAQFRSANRLSNGQTQFKYEQNFDDKAGELGDLTIPEMIRIGLPLFKSADPSEGYAINARFRYRIHSGRLKMWYELVRPERVLEDAVNTVHEKLVNGLQDNAFSFYHGRTN